MSLSAPDIRTLRDEIQRWLWKNVPKTLSSKNGQFASLTGVTQAQLEANWKAGKIMTACNAFAGNVARAFGVPKSSVLAKGALDISQADKEVPGCWQDANSAEACTNDLTPNAGDFYSSWAEVTYKGSTFIQKFAHVGIVYSYDRATGEWWVVEAGQGGPKMGFDLIKWNSPKFARSKLNGWVDIGRYLMPNGPYATNGEDEEHRAAIDQYQRQ